MARRLDHSKGGQYQADPARVQRTIDFDQPDEVVIKGKVKSPPTMWGSAMIALRRFGLSTKETAISQEDLLTSLGITRKDMRSRHRRAILKRLISDGVLLKDGKPNLDNPKVLDVIIQNRKGR